MQTLPRLRMKLVTLTTGAALAVGSVAAPVLFADQPGDKPGDKVETPAVPAQPDAAPDAAPAAAPQQSASVTPEAKKLIEQVDAAYASLQRLDLTGTFSADLSAAGQERKESKNFTATFAAPNKFRHAMQDDVVVGSTGEKAYAYVVANKLYKQAEAPKEKAELAKMLEPIPEVIQVVQMQNPSLMFAVAKSAAAELNSTFSEIRKVQDTKLDGSQAPFPTLSMTLPNRMVVTMLFDPQTHLLRRSSTDIKPMLEERGTPEVKNATLTVDYTSVKANDAAAVKDEQFAWAPPEGAKDQAEMAAAPDAGGEPAELEGKPAPAFSMKDMNDKAVALKDLKGKVVVMDLWATWCPPCRASLPHLDKLYEETKDKGVSVFAVNVQEDKEDVANFIKQTNLKTPVLLDADGAVSQAYRAKGIPQTVVIGKDGTVKKVIVGFGGEETAKELKAAVEQAMSAS